MTSQERFVKVMNILNSNNLALSSLYMKQFDKLSESELFMDEKINEIVSKIKTYDEALSTDEHKYSEEIMRDVRRNLGYDELDVSHDNEIMKMEKREVFNRYCVWNGLCGGYGDTLLDAVEDIYDIEL